MKLFLNALRRDVSKRAEYIQKQEENKANEKRVLRPLYMTTTRQNPKKKASVRNSYNADSEMKKVSVRNSYNADIEFKQSAKRQRYQEDLEENSAVERQKQEDNSAANTASERSQYQKEPSIRLAKRAARRTPYCRGHRTTTTTQWYVMACCIALALKS